MILSSRPSKPAEAEDILILVDAEIDPPTIEIINGPRSVHFAPRSPKELSDWVALLDIAFQVSGAKYSFTFLS